MRKEENNAGDSKDKLLDHLTEELAKTGYPLEVEISSLLDNKYVVFNNKYFFDWDENKAREIDVFADLLWGEYESGGKFDPEFNLAVECKKSDAYAWIFITRPETIFQFHGQLVDFLSQIAKDAQSCFMDDILSICNTHLHYDTFGRVAKTYVEIKYQGQKQKGEKSEIFEAKNQLVKFVAYDIQQLLARLKHRHFDPVATPRIWLYHPIIVFDGKLYEAIVKDGSPQLFETKHLLLATSYSPPYIDDFPETMSPDLPYLIDVVRKDYFIDFLQIVKSDYSTLWKCISSNAQNLSAALTGQIKRYSVEGY